PPRPRPPPRWARGSPRRPVRSVRRPRRAPRAARSSSRASSRVRRSPCSVSPSAPSRPGAADEGPAMSSDITCWSTAREMAAAVAAREISARELLELHLDRIEEVNSQVNALVSIDPERARAAADAADRRTMSGEPLGALHGLPYAVKDTHEVEGWRKIG